MNEDDFEELVAQVDEHGVGAVTLLYNEANSFAPVELQVTNVQYEDGKIVVRLER